MENLQIASPLTPVLSQVVIAEFKASLKGELLSAGDAGYDAARVVWNAMINRRPALIARCINAADVVCAVTFARTHQLLVSVRGGGHNVAGKAVCDAGLMIDLSPMKGIAVDPAQRTARVEPGVLWGGVRSSEPGVWFSDHRRHCLPHRRGRTNFGGAWAGSWRRMG